jgi:site-specific recombinase XerD
MSVNPALFFEHVEPFIDYRQVVHEISDQTIRTNRIDLKLFRDFVKERNVQTISGPTLVGFQYHLKKARKNSGPSINRKIFTLKSYAKFLKLEEVEEAEKLPFDDVVKIRGGYRNRPDALRHEQLAELFEAIDRTNFLGIRDYAAYALMYNLGLRVGEVHHLNLDNLDLENKKITVAGKGKKRRELPLNDEMRQILTEWLAVRKHLKGSDLSSALFVSKKGNRLAIRTLEDNFKKLLKKVVFKVPFKVTCHTLRHSFASHLNDNGEDILVIQSLLGHASPRSTRIYIHPSETRVRQALENLPGVKFINQLIEEGVLNLNFQPRHRPQRE